ncbi:MAG: N-acetylmuramoyl-L-alanine amidase [Solibacillus sp.]
MSNYKKIEIHAGHWKALNSGAVGILNEVTENRRVGRRVYEILKAANVPVMYYEDNVSTNQRENINHLVKHHNADQGGLVVSFHFNSSGATTDRALGTEVLYSTQKTLAEKLSKAISEATGGGLLNRGAKYRNDLGVLTKTVEPAILPEICFVNSTVDAAIYRRDFEKICQAVATVLAAEIGYTVKEPVGVEASGINSPALKAETELILGSAARRKMIIDFAIDQGANKSWSTKLEKRTITDEEIQALAIKAIVDFSK